MLQIILTILSGTTFTGIIGWVFHLGNRVSVLEAQRDDLTILINSQFANVGQRLDRIERAMNGQLKG